MIPTPESECAKRFLTASKLVNAIDYLEKRGNPLDAISDFSNILCDNDWEYPHCGEFARWWELYLLQFLSQTSKVVHWVPFEIIIIDKWLLISFDMLNDPKDYCEALLSGYTKTFHTCCKATTLDPTDWLDHYKYVLGLSNSIGKKIVIQTVTAFRISFLHRNFRAQNAYVFSNLLKLIGKYAQKNQKICKEFYALAIVFAKYQPEIALTDISKVVLDVAEKVSPVSFISYVGKFFDQIHFIGHVDTLNKYADRTGNWVKLEKEKKSIKTMRKAQEDFIPHMRGHLPRHRRKTSSPTLTTVIIFARAKDNQAVEVCIDAVIADVSSGNNFECGFGIRIKSDKWQFNTKESTGYFPHDAPQRPQIESKVIEAKNIQDNSLVALINNPIIEIHFNGKEYMFKSKSLWGFKYRDEYSKKLWGAVVYLHDNNDAGELKMFKEWQDHVRSQFHNVDYGEAGVVL